LIAPKVSIQDRIFKSPPRKADIKKKYGLDTLYAHKLEQFVDTLKPVFFFRFRYKKKNMIFLNSGVNPMSEKPVIPADFPWLSKYSVNKDDLYSIIVGSRTTKTQDELDVMKESTKISVAGHIEMMRKSKPKIRESELMCHFRHHSLYNYNIKFKAYPDIVASGRNASVLHYVTNDKIIQDGELVLCDCAHSLLGYCSDITTTFPANGKFSVKQKYFSNM